MCGIIGTVGKHQALDVLLDGLSRLEYRGYDSAGIAVMDQSAIRVVKAAGRLENLKQKLEQHPPCGSIGIGHTRWATHGRPGSVNAHPHTSTTGRIAVVHNGVIENHCALRSMLVEKGVHFVSETDTEAIAHLLEMMWDGSMMTTLRKTAAMLQGSYALAVLCSAEPDALFCIRKDSPLLLGYGNGAYFLASDISALLPFTRSVEALESGEMAVLRRSGVWIYSADGSPRPLHPVAVGLNSRTADKNGFPHFMLKEIHEQPEALRKTLSAFARPENMQILPDLSPVSPSEAACMTRIHLIGCGTAFHACLAGAHFLQHIAHIPAQAHIASEFHFQPSLHAEHELFIGVSQSGETADTLSALRVVLQHSKPALALTNTPVSTLAQLCGKRTLFTHAGPEIAVASTKAYTTQLEALLLFAMDLAVKRGKMRPTAAADLLCAMSRIPAQIKEMLNDADRIARFAEAHAHHQHILFIGRGPDHAVAMEASLKLKEVSYLLSEAYPAGELKHGTFALIDRHTLVIALMTQPDHAVRMRTSIQEVRARGAEVLVVTSPQLCSSCPEGETWLLPDVHPLLAPIAAIVPLQLLAYHTALQRGCDVDKPRNLAKSVTVE